MSTCAPALDSGQCRSAARPRAISVGGIDEEDMMWVHADSLRRSKTVRRSPLLSYCSEPGCMTLTMGGTCVAHDPADPPSYPFGVPYVKERPFVRATQREVRSRIPVG